MYKFHVIHIHNISYCMIMMYDRCSFSTVLMVFVSAEGNSTAGETHILYCTGTKAENVTGSIALQWTGPNGEPVVNGSSVVLGEPSVSGQTTTLSLRFSILYTSNGGQHRCQASLLTGGTQNYFVSSTTDVIVKGIYASTTVVNRIESSSSIV